jgi:formylglycine-generating enzyme required for sulfatase activity
VFSAGHDGRIVFWDGALGAKLVEWQFPGSVFDLALSADGRHLAASNANGTTTIFRVPENLRAPGTLTTTQAKARQQQAAKNLAVAKEIRNSLGMKLNLIPAGRFIMGSSDDEADRKANESPYHVKRISQPFYLGIHPVTVGQFRKFVQVTKYRTEAEKDGQGGFSRATGEWKPDPKSTWLNPEFSQEDDHPVVNVSLEDAAAFCRWLSAKEKKVYRLPTEAEWEVACRAGTQTPFSFGATLDAKQANIMVKIGKTTKVGAYSANPFGLYDMHGNVSQWCADPYQDSYLHDIFGVEALTPGQNLPGVSRGGNWSSVARACRCAFRENHARNYRSSALGFRVVCVIGSEGSRQEK